MRAVIRFDSLPSSLVYSIVGYPALLAAGVLLQGTRSSQKNHWQSVAFTRSIKAISTCHALVSTVMVARELLDERWQQSNLITTKSDAANWLVGLETGYLIQDTIVILLAQKYLSYRPERLVLFHHFILAPLLFLFLQYAAHGRELGVYFVASFIGMNASTPFVNLRWAFRQYLKFIEAPSRLQTLSRRMVDTSASVSFLVARVGLIYYMLRVYGSRTDQNTPKAFLSLPIQCKIGTSSLVIVNLLWWAKMMKTNLRSRSGSQRKLA